MKIRSSRISSSIIGALGHEDDPNAAKKSLPSTIVDVVVSFFSFFRLPLARYRSADFLALRHDAWQLDESDYLVSFQGAQPADDTQPQPASPDTQTPLLKGKSKSNATVKSKAKAVETELISIGDLGYSGSTFFTTPNAKYLIKALPRQFEHAFFTHELLSPYAAHMKAHPDSLLVRIVDMVFTPLPTLGGILGTAPTHHIIMENLLYGRDVYGPDPRWRERWETYDLKPNDYFVPERDVLDGVLASDATRDKLFDEFPDRVAVTAEQKRALLALLAEDTQLLADHGAVDYSLFLVRYPGPRAAHRALAGTDDAVPVLTATADPWRAGVDDVDGEWTYRLVVLDFFWAKHTMHARAMTRLVKTWGFFANTGPMTITAKPGEYRERFLKMVDTIVVEK